VCRRLVDAGAHVAAGDDRGRHHFVGRDHASRPWPASRCRPPVERGDPIPHTRLGQGADLIVVAPATARLLADYAAGRSHDLLTATLLATRAPVVVCPAMHTEMWEHPAVQENLATLRRVACTSSSPKPGRSPVATSDTVGSPTRARIVAADRRVLSRPDLAGPHRAGHRRWHREPSIRCASSATARRASRATPWPRRCAGVPGHARHHGDSLPGARPVEVVSVESAAEMQDAVTARAGAADVVVMAAAVADFRPVAVAPRQDQEGRAVAARSASSPRRHPRRARRTKPRPGAGRLRRRDHRRGRQCPAKLGARCSICSWPTTSAAPATGFEHDTNEVTVSTRPARSTPSS
jgi:phosphopantothenoylcysteine decarboxylase/phosphopantothenate--cysteine ligase